MMLDDVQTLGDGAHRAWGARRYAFCRWRARAGTLVAHMVGAGTDPGRIESDVRRPTSSVTSPARRGRVRAQCLAGRRHVRGVPKRPLVGERELARVLRRLRRPAARPPPRRRRRGATEPFRPRPRPRHAARRHRSPRRPHPLPCPHRAPAPAPADGHGDAGGCPGAPHRRARRERAATWRRCGARRRASPRTWRRRCRSPPPRACARSRPSSSRSTGSMLNQHLARTSGGKVSFTHLIGFAVVRALEAVPAAQRQLRPRRRRQGDSPASIRHDHVGLGLAVDVEKSDGTRTLLVPVIREARVASTSASLRHRLRGAGAQGPHRQGDAPTTSPAPPSRSPTPGTLGTVQSVPRLMPGQGAIVGVGALGYPAEYQAADRRSLAAHRRGSGGHAHVDLRPPHHPGRGVGAVPVVRDASASPASTASTSRCLRRHGRALRAGALAGRRQRRGQRAPAASSSRCTSRA